MPIRALMVANCMGVSFAHGSNDGQKGMGLIMLILIGTLPAAYALNHDVTAADVQSFMVASAQVESVLERHIDPRAELGSNPQSEVADYIRSRQLQPNTVLALHAVIWSVNHDVEQYKTIRAIPSHEQANVRNDMYVAAEALRMMEKSKNPSFTPAESVAIKAYQTRLDKSTKFIPDWVKVAVALALGLGTMVGWKRIVITVGERIGKSHLTYAQGASAEIVAMGTIWAAGAYGLPVSTTHVLSSGVAGTMAASKSGLHGTTIRNIAMAWVLTLPACVFLGSMLFAGGLYAISFFGGAR